jgi:Ca2+-binding RTX toxin-like protein
MTEVTLTSGEIDSGLQSGYKLAAAQFTYSIPGAGSTWETSPGNYSAGGSQQQPFTSYSTLNATQAANFRLALAGWDGLITPNFTEVADGASGHGEVRAAFTSYNMGGSTAGYAFQGSNQTPTSIVGDVWLNSTDVGLSYAVGTTDYTTFIHELGHVLGLKHPFENPTLAAQYDNTRYTVMSYTVPYAVIITPTGGGGYSISKTPVNAITPQVLDIKAVQDLYGAASANTGNDTYTLNQTALTMQSIYDTGGTDTLDLSAITRENIVDLRPGSYSSIGHWTATDQQAYYAGLTGASLATIAGYYATGPTPNNYYEWNDNLGIAYGTTIENVLGGSGNDTITGNDADNLFNLRLGGVDNVNGGLGNDGFVFGATLTAADVVDGGAGTGDQVGLQGNYAGLTLGAGNLTNIESLVLLPGSDTRFGDLSGALYSYNLTTVDANVTAGQLFTVNWNTLRAGENVTFNGSAETNGSFLTYGGLGADSITGGTQLDGFYFGPGRFGATDVLTGGTGNDQLGLQGDYSGINAVTFGSGQLTSIDTLVLLSGADTRFGGGGLQYNYSLTMNDANVAAGQTMIVNANTLRSNEVLTFAGTAETNGSFTVYAGAGADHVSGGSGNDSIYGQGGADTLTGGGGFDLFYYLSTANSSAASPDLITDFSGDRIDLSAIDANTNTPSAVNNEAFLIVSAFDGFAGELRFDTTSTPGFTHILGDTNGDTVAELDIMLFGTISLSSFNFVL